MGAVLRYLVSSHIARWAGSGFPWGTLAVNVLGALVMGVFVGLFARFWQVGEATKLFLTTGLLGGFTTFSAFSLEVVLMLERQQWLLAFTYSLASVVLCAAVLLAALWLLRAVPA